MLRESALSYLQNQETKVGETVQLGWFWFRIVEGDDGIDIETLDFKKMASFTRDFQITEQIYWAQNETLRRLKIKGQDCTLMDSAIVSKSYNPGDPRTFIERSDQNSHHDSGWYIGLQDDEIDMNDEESFKLLSLYELTIHDQWFARYWLLPVGFRVFFDQDVPEVIRV